MGEWYGKNVPGLSSRALEVAEAHEKGRRAGARRVLKDRRKNDPERKRLVKELRMQARCSAAVSRKAVEGTLEWKAADYIEKMS